MEITESRSYKNLRFFQKSTAVSHGCGFFMLVLRQISLYESTQTEPFGRNTDRI